MHCDLVKVPDSLEPNWLVADPEKLKGRCVPIPFSMGTVYFFPKAGDVLPTHTHPKGRFCHISIVWKGEIEFTEDGKSRTVKDEDREIIDTQFDVPHGFKALTDGAILLNIRKPVPA